MLDYLKICGVMLTCNTDSPADVISIGTFVLVVADFKSDVPEENIAVALSEIVQVKVKLPPPKSYSISLASSEKLQ